MKPQELRIGNYVTYMNEYNTVRVTGIDDKIIEASGDWNDDKDYQPIQITEDWLLAFGFIKQESPKITYLDIDDEYSIRILEGHWELHRVADEDDNIPLLKYPKYVHELQNLYFALTGKELQKKLK